jgi:protein-S-isoprenylcysteine O-methyltransferase Ste14
MSRLFAALRSLVYGSAFVLLWAWVVVSVRPWDARIPLSIPAWTRAPGIVLVALGGALALWCVATFIVVGRGTPAPFDAPRVFVAVGPYRYVRNPMYLGAGAVIIGAGLVLRSPSAVLVAPFFLLAMGAFVLLYEEPALKSRFGESYLRYKQRVHRWWPLLPWRAP